MEAKKKTVLGPVLGMLAVAALCGGFLWLRLRHLSATGQRVNWLAELWAPCSLLSIIIVTFVEKISKPGDGHAPKKTKKSSR